MKIEAYYLAARFAQEIGLPPGNFWEMGIAQKIAQDLENHDYATTTRIWRFRLFGTDTPQEPQE
jgi:hypothetical protein